MTSPPRDPAPGRASRDDGAELPRPTPYELALGADEIEEHLFPAIREEAAARGVETLDPQAFVMLGRVGTVLRDLVVPSGSEPAGRMLEEAGRLLYQGFHFWNTGKSVLVADSDVVRRVLERSGRTSAPVSGPLLAPEPAGYLQLPKHRFWGRIEEEAVPEPVDGFFWTVSDSVQGRVARLETLFVLGIRVGRPGFSVVDASGVVPSGGAPSWAEAAVRPVGRDFDNVLPGGELEALHAITTIGEALKLVDLMFRHIATAGFAPEPSRSDPLPYRRLRLG